jgi:formate dehydrogenase accessory protein FdhD
MTTPALAVRVATEQSSDTLEGLGYADTSSSWPLTRLGDTIETTGFADVAEEVPIALVYNGRSHVVVMGTPSNLEDLAVGFSLTESIVEDASRVEHIDLVKASHGIELQIQIPAAHAELLEQRTRGLVARTGCGLCGVETIKEAMRVPVRVGDTLSIEPRALWRAADQLAERQTLNNHTNAVHAAAWATRDGDLNVVREDVGRHNALDKVLGAITRDGRMASAGFVIVTSRASYEMVQKAATCSVELIAAISRPTGLAIRFAQASGVTLVGLLRGRTANVYAGRERITMGATT